LCIFFVVPLLVVDSLLRDDEDCRARAGRARRCLCLTLIEPMVARAPNITPEIKSISLLAIYIFYSVSGVAFNAEKGHTRFPARSRLAKLEGLVCLLERSVSETLSENEPEVGLYELLL
jgi:hypothetical protein